MSANDVLEQALGLSEVERLDLAERLLDSVDHEPSADEDLDLDPSYALELQRRLDEALQDRSVLCDGDEVLCEARRFVS